MTEIKPITTQKTYTVRHAVLRQGLPLESCFFDGDNNLQTIHFGHFTNDELTGIVSVFKQRNNVFQEQNQYQLRGMAVIENAQKNGAGTLLLKTAEKHCSTQNADLIWFNARENAVGFYQKMGYTIIGSVFVIQDAGNHYVMFKKL